MGLKVKHIIVVIIVAMAALALGIAVTASLHGAKEGGKPVPDKHVTEKAEKANRAFYDGNLVEALTYDMDFVNNAGRWQDVYGSWLADAYFRIGLVFAYFDDIPNSTKYNLKAYDMAMRTKHYKHIIAIITNIAGDYMCLGDYHKATEYNNKLLELKVDREESLCYYYITLGEISMKAHSKDSPIAGWEKAYDIMRKRNEHNSEAYLLNDMASYYGAIGQDSLRLEYLKKAYAASVENKNPQVKLSSTRAMLDYYIEKGDDAGSMVYGKAFLSLLDSSMSTKRFLETKSAQEQYEQMKAEKNIKDLNVTISKHRLVALGAITAFIIALVVLAIIFYQKRKVQEAYRALYKMNLEVMGKRTVLPTCVGGTAKTDEDKSGAVSSQQSDGLYNQILKVMENPDVYCDADFGLSTLTSLVGSNVAYVSKVINAHFGQNVPTFINTYRIDEARRRILDTAAYGNLTLQAIGESVGYNTQVNFNRAFKQITGMTPSAFQKMSVAGKP